MEMKRKKEKSRKEKIKSKEIKEKILEAFKDKPSWAKNISGLAGLFYSLAVTSISIELVLKGLKE